MVVKEYIKYLKDNPKNLWFKRRWYGWGWVPVKWQGWIVILIFVGFLVLNGIYLDSKTQINGEVSNLDLYLFIGITIFLVLILILICYKKGEKPRWSWGK